MSNGRRPSRADWLAAIATGALLGAPILGAGSRIGMRVIAVARDQAPNFTIDGSIAVVLMGAVTGAIMGAIFALSRTVAPGSRLRRGAFFWMLIAALVWRGLSPVGVLEAVLFAPLFLVHGVLLTLYWCRVRLRSRVLALP